MKNKQKNSKRVLKELRLDDIPLSSSLGLLAYGDITFKLWRENKKNSKTQSNE